MSETAIRLLRIRGRVQGVGYRAFLCDAAAALGLSGWTRNRADGSVEALIVGEAQAMALLIGSLRRGPPGAKVTAIDMAEPTPETPGARSGDFRVLPTL